MNSAVFVPFGTILMLQDPRLADLLLRWQQCQADGLVVTFEELCSDCPDLLEEIINGPHTLEMLLQTPHGMAQKSGEVEVLVPATASLLTIGDYQFIRELRQGGMGVVYQAFDRKRRKMVALKTLRRIDPSAVYRLKQEFRALAEVAHRNLVELYELISTGQQCVIAMELIDGDHFLRYIRQGFVTKCDQSVENAQASRSEHQAWQEAIPDSPGVHHTPLSRLQYDRLRQAFCQLAEGILALHSFGKLHRDIKPSNVMVTRDGRVVLLDFGLAAELNRDGVHQSTEQHVTGTVAYMAPEQAASRAQSAASDWYSVGVMLYEALTGQLPFTGSPVQVLIDKQQQEPVAPAVLMPGLPEDLNNLCVDLLRKSAAARPTGQEVLQRLADSAPVNASGNRLSVPTRRSSFVGRATHLVSLTDSFHAMRKGRTVVVCLQGRSGAGKSMLAQHFLDDLMQSGNAVVLTGKCYERESVPYKTLDSLIDSLSRYLRRLPTLEAQAVLPRESQILAQVFPVLRRVDAVANAPGRVAEILDPHELRRRAFEALRELLARLGDRKPLVLFIDDLQWGDLDGATQLVRLLQPPESPVLMLLACYRSEDAYTSPCLEILHRELAKAGTGLDQRELSVDPLGHAEACELALELLCRRDSSSLVQAEIIARESGGNPFFVHELVQCVGSSVAVVGGPAAGALVLDEVLWTRIQSLPDEPRRLLEVIAVSGQPLRRDEARQAAEFHEDEHGTMGVLRSGRLIRSSGSVDMDEIETYHDRIRETIISHLPIDAVKDLHLRIAVVLETTVPVSSQESVELISIQSLLAASDPTHEKFGPLRNQMSKRFFDLAYHFDAAGESERAFPYAMAMADQARSQYALEIAEQLYRIAERGAEHADLETRFRVAESLGDVLMLRGRYPESAIQFKYALSLTTLALAQAQLEGKLAELAFKCGDMKTAIEATERALRMLGNCVPSWSVTFLFGLLRQSFVQILHTLLPRLFLARKKLERVEKQLLTIRLHNRLTYCYWFGRGQIPCLWSHLRGMNLAEQYPPTLELAQAYSIHAPVMHLVAQFSRGIAYGQKSFAIYKSLGDLWGQGQSSHFHGHVLHAASRFGEAIEKCREAERLLERTGDYWEVNIARYHTALSLYRLGDLPAAVTLARRVQQSGLELGDIQASGVSLDVWVMASGGDVSPETLQHELRRLRADVQVSAQVMLAEGVRLFWLDRVDEAAVIIGKGQLLAKTAGVSNPYVHPLGSWLATVLRRQAEKTPMGTAERITLLKRASKVAHRALKVARTFQNDLPHALREIAFIAAMQGQIRLARRHVDESLAVAERQCARFEQFQSLLARGQVGQQHGWPDAQQDLATARQALRTLGADFALDVSLPLERPLKGFNDK